MIFNAKVIMPPIPEGTVRVIRIIAWRPKRIADKIYWLCTYERVQVYEFTEKNVKIDGAEVLITVKTWYNLADRCLQ